MSLLSLMAIAVAGLTLAGLAFDLPDRWFCALLALAALLGSADAAVRGLRLWTVLLLIGGALFAGASVHAVYAVDRERRQP
ncbi:hypothetical protein [Streptomyces sp. NPDC056160]|uniref:hypothetical protein n=1 Tax=Streptomyces sp. NPDC056160 TaxID=3345731 RepID=UPI0035DE28DD